MNNFLCFGEDNFVHFSRLRGLNIIDSDPPNQGGKTTFTVDGIKFLLYGNTTKTDKNEGIFNTYSGKDELVVRGLVEMDSGEFIIERKLTRKAKRAGGWTINNNVNYYWLLPDGDEETMNDEDAKKTTEKIRSVVGLESDFELTVLATGDNLIDLIDTKPTERGKILTRFIGLEPIEMKHDVAKKMHNEFTKTMKSNIYDLITLQDEIATHKGNIELCNTLLADNKKKLANTTKEIEKQNKNKEDLIGSKHHIDDEINSINPEKLVSEIKDITDRGVIYKNKISDIDITIKEIGELNFDEDKHHELTNESNQLNINIGTKEAEYNRILGLNKQLKEGEICPSCNRPLDDVDHSDKIDNNSKKMVAINGEVDIYKRRLVVVTDEINTLNLVKTKVDEKNKLELQKDRAEVEIIGLRNELTEKNNEHKKYKLNLDAIELNRKLDSQISLVNTNIQVEQHTKDELITKISKIEEDISQNNTNIENKTDIIDKIKKEDEIDKIFKMYISMVGKKGISKLVLRSVLPIINSELQRLLEDICDFEIELNMNDKNDVEFKILKDGVVKPLKSGSGYEKTAASLAIRSVLGKMSSLPMPNFIVFDEIFGKVHDSNIEKMKPLIDRIRDMYDIVLLITHRDIVKDWGDKYITVKKVDNISTINVK
jgi:exonuclease SbcC